MSSAAPASGDTVAGRVLTTANVVSVVARLGGYQLDLIRQDAGVFALSMTLPQVPFFLRHRYNVEVFAATADGRIDSVRVPIQIR